MPDPFDNDVAVHALHQAYQHAIQHGLTASGFDVSHLRYEGGVQDTRAHVRLSSYTYPRDFVDWITSLNDVRVRVERRGQGYGNDLLFYALSDVVGLKWRISWHLALAEEHRTHNGWFCGGDHFLKEVAPVKVRESRFLHPSEVEKLIAWGHTFEWQEKDA